MPINEPGGLRKQIQMRRKPQPPRRRVDPQRVFQLRYERPSRPRGVLPGTVQRAWQTRGVYTLAPPSRSRYSKRQRRLV